MNILITNTVPINGGDRALLEATISFFKDLYPSARFNILSNNAPLCQQHIPQYNFDWDWEYVTNIFSTSKFDLNVFIRKLLNHFKVNFTSRTSMLFASKSERRVFALYKKADLVVSGAGGYIHDFYGYENRFRSFDMAFELDKKVIMFCQSIGPFWLKENYKRIRETFGKMALIILRENVSFEHIKKIGYTKPNITLSTDIAFYLNSKIKTKNSFSRNKKEIVLNFRNWAGDKNEIKNKAVSICINLVEKEKCNLTFLSTCQGIERYIDDSVFAQEIFSELPDSIKKHCTIDKKNYSLNDRIEKFSQFDAYIGMRLHGAILSLLGETPAFVVGYEDKSKGIYKDLNMSDFEINYKQDINEINLKIGKFISVVEIIKEKIPSTLKRIRIQNFDSLKKEIKATI